MTLREVIDDRQHKYNEQLGASCSDQWKGYMIGWHNAYKDLAEILEQNGFNIEQIVFDRIPRDRKVESVDKDYPILIEEIVN